MFCKSLPSTTKRFARSEDGNIAVLFALSLMPILCFVGAAVDYSRATNARTAMQGALDAAALMVAKDFSSKKVSQTDIPTTAEKYFRALYAGHPEAENVTVTTTYNPPTGSTRPSVVINGTAAIRTNFMQIAGYPSLGLSASATTTWGNNRLRVALVLDNSGSMDKFNKLPSLQSASKSLVSQLSALEGTPGDVYISVVPFASEVNVGTSHVNDSWLRWDLFDQNNSNSSGSYCSQGSNSWLPRALCKGHGYNWNHTSFTQDKTKWTGCVSDRDQPNDVNSVVPSSTATNFVADQDSYCPDAALLPLTYSWSTINSRIDSMTASGATNQTIGLQWGWLSLLQQSPLNAPALDPQLQYQHVIVLFTDGLNTINRWTGSGSGATSDPDVDARMQLLCSAVQAAKITLFAVQVDTDGAGESKVLPNCAGRERFYLLKNSADIANTFAAIGTEITKLHVSR
jgi:Flp pilus assembly protein TadG